MALQRKARLLIIQIGLGLVIVVLTYFLYDSITAPWEAIQRDLQLTVDTRSHMSQVRVALRRYYEVNGRFPHSLDSLETFVAADSIINLNPDSMFGGSFDASLFLTSARSGAMFEYSVNDTSRVKIYLLKDPDSDDAIGSAEPDITELHASTWE